MLREFIRAALLAILLTPMLASACSVPVFRYGLEHWLPDAFEALVFHRGTLTEEQSDAIAILKREKNDGRSLNLSVRTVDLDNPADAEWQEAWNALKGDSLPWMIVRPNPRTGINWLRISRALTPENARLLIDSPARREFASRIAAGQSTVWLLLKSGDSGKDTAAAKQLKERIKYLHTILKLPQLDAADVANGLISVPPEDLRLEFSVLEISRDDPAEELFVKMLLGTESDLAELSEPIAFPIFGRGRALYALVGKGINNETIDQAAIYLTGSCSCEVKEQNPGVDLLMAAHWEEIVAPTKKTNVQSQATNTVPFTNLVADNLPQVVRFDGSAKKEPIVEETTGFAWMPMLGVIAGALLVMLLIKWARAARSKE